MYGESNQEDIGRANAENIRAGEYSRILLLLLKSKIKVQMELSVSKYQNDKRLSPLLKSLSLTMDFSLLPAHTDAACKATLI
ncbi:uncharacterized [Tachysurus ichikawai]